MNKLPLLCLACAALLALPACKSDPSKPPPTLDQRLAGLGWKQGPEVDEIRRYTIDGWNPIDDTHLVMDAGPSRAYLITLRFSCINLDFVEGLRFTTSPPAALTRLDEVIVPEPGGHQPPQRCPIDTIHELAVLKPAAGK
jgi:Family of unknown function (DUF6491)